MAKLKKLLEDVFQERPKVNKHKAKYIGIGKK